MSRSYKKTPVLKMIKDSDFKRIYNRKLRRSTGLEDIPNGNAYRKMNCSWAICDYRSRHTLGEYLSSPWLPDDCPREELVLDWKKYYLFK